jgi:hypothetical protein
MSDDMGIIRGSGNVFRDLGQPDADREQLRACSPPRSSACWMTAN